MPTYAYQCRVCEREFEVWTTIADRNKPQRHCGKKAKRIMNAPMVAPLFQPYKAVGTDGRIVRTKREHLDMLLEFGKVEVGNDSSMAPPDEHPDEIAARNREFAADLNQITASEGMID